MQYIFNYNDQFFWCSVLVVRHRYISIILDQTIILESVYDISLTCMVVMCYLRLKRHHLSRKLHFYTHFECSG